MSNIVVLIVREHKEAYYCQNQIENTTQVSDEIKQVITTPSGKKNTFEQIENTTGVQTTTGWIDKVTLDKGANTILGMSKQVDQFGNVVRGNNYANPDFYAYENGWKHRTKSVSKILVHWAGFD